MIIIEEIGYYDGDVHCLGYLAYDDAYQQQKRPCVMIAPDWGGRGRAGCNKARQLASMGYVGFAIDIYGEATLGKDKAQRRALMTPFMQNRALLAARILAAFNTAGVLPQVDSEKIAAIGYCFGGLCALDLARTGVNLRGAVSFHGLLTEPPGMPAQPIQAKLLVLHGYDDPLVPPLQLTQFATEMTSKKADWQLHIYGLTAHSFTDPTANDDEMGLHYNPSADHRSWASLECFLKEVLS